MAEWKLNPISGQIYFHLWHIESVRQVPFKNTPSRQNLLAILRRAARCEAPIKLYVEGEVPAAQGSKPTGCLLLGSKKRSGEPAYHAAILNEDSFPSCGFVAIAPSTDPERSLISELRAEGWHNLSFSDAIKLNSVRIVLTALSQVEDSDGRICVPINNLTDEPKDEMAYDPECTRRLKLVMSGKMTLSKATVPFSHVRLFDPNFASQLDPDVVLDFVNSMVKHKSEALVYWDGDRFVASDDYYHYAAYQMISATSLPVVIMGKFPDHLARVTKHGGQELLPPIARHSGNIMQGATHDLRDWFAKKEAQQSERLPPPTDLMVSWVMFAEMLAEDDINERTLHDFLLKNPIVMGGQWDSVQSEVSLGGQYRADLVLSARRALPTVRLVELERSTHRIFTKDLQETAEATHAVQQVSDWLRWWRQHPDHPIVAPSLGVNPDGLVVIGRSAWLSEREREALAHNNQNRSIKIITYDELLDDFGSLILHRLDDANI